jgi:aspartate racemase
MKTIGLLGGMSWESTALYYRLLNEGVRDRLGGLHSAECVVRSVDFEPVEQLQRDGKWTEAGDLLPAHASGLERAGADMVLLCTNTMHIVDDQIEQAISVPFLHLADATAAAVLDAGVEKVGLLGTAFTMEKAFYKDRLASHGIDVIVPDEPDRDIVHRVIYDELCVGVVNETSKKEYLRIIDDLVRNGAQGVVSGCTEIELLVSPEDCVVPLFRTTQIHVDAAIEIALS